jgi:outer membrane protein assembly factor BamE (lipoprotein component of BamABCDE complex)
MKRELSLAVCGVSLVMAACTPLPDQARDVAAAQAQGDKLTLGTVQRQIHVGMSGADVVAALGSPNVVTTDERRRETWVYDRIATEQVYSSSAGGVNALFLAGVSGHSGISQTTQRTLTVIILFDEVGRVRDFSYRSSSF